MLRVANTSWMPGVTRTKLRYFHPEAPSTLLMRVNALLTFHKAAGWSYESFPCSEIFLYEHLETARAGGAKSSQMSSLVEALVFTRHVLQVEELDEAIKSRRCSGAARRGAKKAREQADPLRVEDMKLLHKLLEDDNGHLWDRAFAGACLCCVYMRARCGDWQRANTCNFDFWEDKSVAYACFGADVHKTVRSKFFDGRPINWIAPALGVVDGNWLETWLGVREELGLTEINPSPTSSPVQTGEITMWMRRVLTGCDHLRTSAHGLKATLLSMAGKRGSSHHDCLILGAHAHGAGMAETYWREMGARPMRLLEGLLQEIRQAPSIPTQAE